MAESSPSDTSSIVSHAVPLLTFTGVCKRFPDGTTALDGVELRVQAGEFVSVVGPSGCGKSTLLRIASGLTQADRGHGASVQTRTIGYVFQDPTLLPWRTVQAQRRAVRRAARPAQGRAPPPGRRGHRAGRPDRLRRPPPARPLRRHADAGVAGPVADPAARAVPVRRALRRPGRDHPRAARTTSCCSCSSRRAVRGPVRHPLGDRGGLPVHPGAGHVGPARAGSSATSPSPSSTPDRPGSASSTLRPPGRPGVGPAAGGRMSVDTGLTGPDEAVARGPIDATSRVARAAAVAGSRPGARRRRCSWPPSPSGTASATCSWTPGRRFLRPAAARRDPGRLLRPVNLRRPAGRPVAVRPGWPSPAWPSPSSSAWSLAVAMSQASWIERSLYPYAVVPQTIPILALVPLFGFWFGFGFFSRVLVVRALRALPDRRQHPVRPAVGRPGAPRPVHPARRRAGCTRLCKLQLPAALPAIFTGLRISAGLAVIGAIVGDFFFKQGDPGIGILIDRYQSAVAVRADVRRRHPVLAARHRGVLVLRLPRPQGGGRLARVRRAGSTHSERLGGTHVPRLRLAMIVLLAGRPGRDRLHLRRRRAVDGDPAGIRGGRAAGPARPEGRLPRDHRGPDRLVPRDRVRGLLPHARPQPRGGHQAQAGAGAAGRRGPGDRGPARGPIRRAGDRLQAGLRADVHRQEHHPRAGQHRRGDPVRHQPADPGRGRAAWRSARS